MLSWIYAGAAAVCVGTGIRLLLSWRAQGAVAKRVAAELSKRGLVRVPSEYDAGFAEVADGFAVIDMFVAVPRVHPYRGQVARRFLVTVLSDPRSAALRFDVAPMDENKVGEEEQPPQPDPATTREVAVGELDQGVFTCCENADPHPFHCPSCRRCMVFCHQCDAHYPDLSRLEVKIAVSRVNNTEHLVTCPCGFQFESGFMDNPTYRATKRHWRHSGHGDLLRH